MPSSEKRDTGQEEGVRVHLVTVISLPGVHGRRCLTSRILPSSVSSFVIFCVTNCQQFCQPTPSQRSSHRSQRWRRSSRRAAKSSRQDTVLVLRPCFPYATCSLHLSRQLN